MAGSRICLPLSPHLRRKPNPSQKPLRTTSARTVVAAVAVMAPVAMSRVARLVLKGATKPGVVVVPAVVAAKVAATAGVVVAAGAVVASVRHRANVNVSMPKASPSWWKPVRVLPQPRRMLRLRRHLAMSRGKNVPSVVGAAVVTGVAMSALTTSNRVLRLNVASPGQTAAMSAAPIETVVLTKMRELKHLPQKVATPMQTP